MKTRVINAKEKDAINIALDALHDGQLVAFPTDTVYGLGAMAHDARAIRQIYRAKMRPVEKAIPVLIGHEDDIKLVALDISPKALLLAHRYWPGPLTLVVKKKPALPAIISDDNTVGIRIPNHPVALILLQKAGPLAVTSANISDQPPATTAQQVLNQLGGRISLIMDGGTAPGGQPSTLVDCLGVRPRILREGPISEGEILKTLGF
jgi:L-threonylcarbamoyladenylate synthase